MKNVNSILDWTNFLARLDLFYGRTLNYYSPFSLKIRGLTLKKNHQIAGTTKRR
jgi:hypothetical protein